MSDATRSQIRAVAAHGLAGSVLDLPDEPLSSVLWSALFDRVRSERVTGHLMEAISSGAMPVTAEQAQQAEASHVEIMCHNLLLEDTLLHLVSDLATSGVECRVLKGSAVAHLDYPDPALRSFADNDLLVRSCDFDEAVAVISAAGHVRRSPEFRPGFDRRFSKGITFTASSGSEIDLHRTFVMGPFGLAIDLDSLWERQSTFHVAGNVLAALAPEERFLHACYHAALGDRVPRLVPQRDIAQMLLFGTLDHDRVEHLIDRWSAGPVVARAVNLTWATLAIADITSWSAWARRFRASAAAERDLAVYTDGEDSSYAAKSLAALHAIPRYRDKAAFVRALAFPQASYRGVPTGRFGRRMGSVARAALHRAVRR